MPSRTDPSHKWEGLDLDGNRITAASRQALRDRHVSKIKPIARVHIQRGPQSRSVRIRRTNTSLTYPLGLLDKQRRVIGGMFTLRNGQQLLEIDGPPDRPFGYRAQVHCVFCRCLEGANQSIVWDLQALGAAVRLREYSNLDSSIFDPVGTTLQPILFAGYDAYRSAGIVVPPGFHLVSLTRPEGTDPGLLDPDDLIDVQCSKFHSDLLLANRDQYASVLDYMELVRRLMRRGFIAWDKLYKDLDVNRIAHLMTGVQDTVRYYVDQPWLRTSVSPLLTLSVDLPSYVAAVSVSASDVPVQHTAVQV